MARRREYVKEKRRRGEEGGRLVELAGINIGEGPWEAPIAGVQNLAPDRREREDRRFASAMHVQAPTDWGQSDFQLGGDDEPSSGLAVFLSFFSRFCPY